MRRLLTAIFFILFVVVGYPQADTAQIGLASFYGKKFEGRKTASGQTFSNSKMTAANKTLPLGTSVKVTNLKNNRSIILTINDRLPKKSKRTIDLTQKGAKELGFIKSGTTKVTIKIIPPEINGEH
jgi:rare lipoprotein A